MTKLGIRSGEEMQRRRSSPRLLCGKVCETPTGDVWKTKLAGNSKGFRDRLHQDQFLRAGKYILPVFRPTSVDGCLEMAEQAGSVLHFIHDEGRLVAGEKRRGVVFRLRRFARQIKRHVFVGAERSSHEARFAGLPCPGQDDHGALRRPAAEETFDETGNPHAENSTIQSQNLQDGCCNS